MWLCNWDDFKLYSLNCYFSSCQSYWLVVLGMVFGAALLLLLLHSNSNSNSSIFNGRLCPLILLRRRRKRKLQLWILLMIQWISWLRRQKACQVVSKLKSVFLFNIFCLHAIIWGSNSCINLVHTRPIT